MTSIDMVCSWAFLGGVSPTRHARMTDYIRPALFFPPLLDVDFDDATWISLELATSMIPASNALVKNSVDKLSSIPNR